MAFTSRQAFSTISRAEALRKLTHPGKGSFVAINIWRPGYSLVRKVKGLDGQYYDRKVFKPTSTLEAAISHLRSHYSKQDFLKYKEDAHPGHVSLLTQNHYLSAGAEVTTISEIGVSSQHNLVFAKNFETDCFGFNRTPDQTIDLHSLQIPEIESTIEEFKKIRKVYNILGGRFGLFQGDSCATSCYVCLVAGCRYLNIKEFK